MSVKFHIGNFVALKRKSYSWPSFHNVFFIGGMALTTESITIIKLTFELLISLEAMISYKICYPCLSITKPQISAAWLVNFNPELKQIIFLHNLEVNLKFKFSHRPFFLYQLKFMRNFFTFLSTSSQFLQKLAYYWSSFFAEI